MKKYIFLILIMISLFSTGIFGQDTLFMMNGKRIATKVQSIDDSVIRYKLSDRQYNSKLKLNKALKNWSIGFGIGSLLPYGEVREYKSYPFDNYYDSRRVGFNVDLNKNINSFLGLQFQFTTGKLYGKKTDEAVSNFNRYFNTDLNEFALNAEINLNRLFLSKDADEKSKLKIYLKAGAGILKYRSLLLNSEDDFYINSFGYKNNGETYGTMQSCTVFPVGGGMKVKLGNNISLRLEALMKFTNTDNLDAEIGNSAYDRYGITSLALVFSPGKKRVSQERMIEKADVYSVKYADGRNVVTFTDPVNNKELVENTHDYVEGEYYADKNYKPRVLTAGSVASGLMGGYLAFYGMLIPTAYVVGSSSMSPGIKDIHGKLVIPEDKKDNVYYIQGFKDKSRKKDVRNSVLGGLAGLTLMIIIKTIHFSGTN